MRAYILTELERQHILNYLEKSKTSDDFYVLLNRVKAHYTRLSEDIRLIETVLRKREIHV